MKNTIKTIIILILTLLLISCTYEQNEIIIGRGSWESNDFYNEIVKIIIEEGYQTRVSIKPVTTPVLVAGLKQKEIHVNVETWSENIPSYNEDITEGYYEELSINFNDNEQGIFTTKYFAKHMATTLNKDINDLYIEDLIHFRSMLKKDSTTNKILIYGGTTEWGVTEFLQNKFSNEEIYPNLVNNFTFEPIRSTPILNSLLISAVDRYFETEELNEDTIWVGYNWKPTAIMGTYDMVLLKDEYEQYDYSNGIGNVPENNVTIVAIPELKSRNPYIYDMLSKMTTSANDASKALSYLEEDDSRTILDTSIWWMKENEEIWKTWVDKKAYDLIKAYLEDK